MQSRYNFLTKNIIPGGIKVKKAQGVRFWDINSKEYLDFSSQTLNLSLGNSHPLIKKAFLKQFEKLTFLSSRFECDTFIRLAKLLQSVSPADLKKVNLKLTNGGDANESAFKRARAYQKKPIIVAFYTSHLGESCETLSANGKHFDRKFIGGSSNFIHLVPPYKNNVTEESSLREIEFLFQKRNDIAAIILEPIAVNAGCYAFSKNYLQQIRKLCNKYKITLIFDEIQTAFGWLGCFFASDYFNVVPDIITIGKAFACGFPLAGVLMKEEYDVLDYGEDEYTYGGHPVSCAIAIENINYLKTKNILNSVKVKSKLIEMQLGKLHARYPKIIKEVRVHGLIAAIEFHSIKNKNCASTVYELCLKNGLVLRKSEDGVGSSLVFKPPIIVTQLEIDKGFAIFDTVLKMKPI